VQQWSRLVRVLTGLTEVERVAAKLGAQVVAVTDLPQAMPSSSTIPAPTSASLFLEPAVGLSRADSMPVQGLRLRYLRHMYGLLLCYSVAHAAQNHTENRRANPNYGH
jgi:hypothetical protein